MLLLPFELLSDESEPLLDLSLSEELPGDDLLLLELFSDERDLLSDLEPFDELLLDFDELLLDDLELLLDLELLDSLLLPFELDLLFDVLLLFVVVVVDGRSISTKPVTSMMISLSMAVTAADHSSRISDSVGKNLSPGPGF